MANLVSFDAAQLRDLLNSEPLAVTNDEFLQAIFAGMEDANYTITCSFADDPYAAAREVWAGRAWRTSNQGSRWQARANNYLTVSEFEPFEGQERRRKAQFVAMRAVMLDDIGPKVNPSAVRLPLSAVVITSPGNAQGWYFLKDSPGCRDRETCERLIDRMISAGLTADAKDPGMKGVTRYGRLPVGWNNKAKYGEPFYSRLVLWEPERRYSVEELARAYGISLVPERTRQVRPPTEGEQGAASHRFTVLRNALTILGHYKGELDDGWHDITCPWINEHTGGADTGSAIREPRDDNHWRGAFVCHHGHCKDARGLRQVEEWLLGEHAIALPEWRNRESIPPDAELPPIESYAEDFGQTPSREPDTGRQAEGETEEEVPDGTPLFITADSLRGQSFEAPDPYIENMLLVGATLVHGPAKKGKSWLLLQMATTIDAGGEFLGRKCRRAGVLYVGAEDTSARFKSRLERMAAWGEAKFMNRDALLVFSKRLQKVAGVGKVTAQFAVEKLWEASGKPSVIFIDTQEVFEVITGIAHGKQGDSITRRDYQATSSYDGIAQKLGIAIVLVGHWGEIKSIEKATTNPHECLNTTKARLAGVLTSITLGPLPNQEPGESTRDMQLSIRSRDIAEGDQFLWVQQSELTGLYRSLGKVREVLLTDSQHQLFDVLIAAYKQHGANHWTSAKELADQLDCSSQAVKQMVGRVRRAAKAKGRPARAGHYELDSKPSAGYRVRVAEQED